MNESLFGFPAPAVAGIRHVVRRFIGGVFTGYVMEPPPSPEVNTAIVLRPRGTGPLQAAVTDGLATGGNARGNYAVDLQLARAAATQVASGTSSTLIGVNSTATGINATSIGNTCVASGTNAVALGANCNATATAAVAIGATCTASGANGTATGNTCTASGGASQAGGQQSSSRGLFGSRAFAAGQFSAAGDAQEMTIVLRRQTTDATTTVLTSNNSAASTTNMLVLGNDTTVAFRVLVAARRTDADNESAGYQITGVIDRNGNAASTALVGAPVVTVLAEDTAAWDVTATADTANGGLSINVTGEAAKTINWCAVVTATEVLG